MAAQQIVVLGGGFAGLWSAVGAARKLDELGVRPSEVEITLVNRDAYHSIRVRNYEANLDNVRIPLDEVLRPIGVRRVEASVTGLDLPGQTVALSSAAGRSEIPFDRLVFALGSELTRPNIPGLADHAWDIDTYPNAVRLNAHLQALPTRAATPGLTTVVVVGAGLTGIEAAAEMPGKLRAAWANAASMPRFRVLLVDHNPRIGSDMGEAARPVIETALHSLGIETLVGVRVASIGPTGLTLDSGEVIPTQTVVWCAGMHAHPLARLLPGPHDHWGRVSIDPFLRVVGANGVFAAGDVASAVLDGQHGSVMSCQHGRPMGRFAGHNVVCDLLGLPMLPLSIDWYVTVLDLGPWGALYTEGWDRRVVAVGTTAKQTKQTINCQRIYPPRSGNRAEILAAAAPTVQRPPAFGRQAADA